MARSDRRFTGEDLRRLYCKNLTPVQRAVFDSTTCDWDDYSTAEQVKAVLDFLANSDVVEDLLDLLPYGGLVKLALDSIAALLDDTAPHLAFLPVTDKLKELPSP